MQNDARRSPAWIWFFLLLVLLSLVAVGIMIRYNLGQQLQPEQLARAQALWRDKGPASYRLLYSVKRGDAEPDITLVHIRNGERELVTVNGRKLDAKQYVWYGMDELFDYIEQFLTLDRQEKAPRTFLRAVFDPEDGHVTYFVRRVMGGRERVEIVVREFQPLGVRAKGTDENARVRSSAGRER